MKSYKNVTKVLQKVEDKVWGALL